MKKIYTVFLLLLGTFSQAQIVDIPDANFKFALISMFCVDTNGDGIPDADADTNNDGEIQESEAMDVISLHVRGFNISSLEGIQSFANLELLSCSINEISNLDMSQNLNLVELYCWENQLTSLNVSQNQNLRELHCSDNQLNHLDVTQNPNLEVIQCTRNQLSNLDVTQNPSLWFIYCDSNQLSSLNVSQNPNLEKLFCWDNQLTSLDLSQNTNLINLNCMDNQLTSLNIKNSNNHNLVVMTTNNNPNLDCIQVDDVVYANSQNCHEDSWCKDIWTGYFENTGDECVLGIIQVDNIEINIYPNPTKNILFVNSKFPIDHLKVYSLQGQLLNESKNNQIDISFLSSGLYTIKIMIDGKTIVKKFIKN